MKPKPPHCLLAIAAILILCGCENNKIKEASRDKDMFAPYIIDTISIYGEKHEIILRSRHYQGGMMHSPECWCGKGGCR